MTEKKKHLYLIGVGGVGMVWIADYALSQGWAVSGSELTESTTVKRLQKAGAKIHIGPNPDQIPPNLTEVIITSAVTPTSPSYPEFEELKRRGLPIRKRAEWIGALTRQKFTIAVSGAHGKTTTTAMIGWILDQAGFDPTVFVGTNMPVWENTTRVGKGQYLVLEADEFDRSFHRFSPQIAVVLNIDLDHTDYYTGGLPEIEKAYRRFLRNLPHRTGIMVGYGRDPHIRKAAKGFKYHFRWYDEDHLWPGLRLTQSGLHLKLNATAAARVAHEVGIDQETIVKALASFPGAGRRFEYMGNWQSVELYDDYGHHPVEIAATLQAARERFPDDRLVLVFQPHQKARTQALLKEFGRAFDKFSPNELILAPIYHVAGRDAESEVSSAHVAEEIAQKAPNNMQVAVAKTEVELAGLVKTAAKKPGIMLLMGAGDIRSLVEAWR